ncbi:divalent-cation tolerance protein CutA [Roseimaritima sediminicola]|uniref:divalent-cation tolerance protein CutA n=1 Tax=Roseimaritima sediminicola TaxID=2662066 RepID=UPI0012982813|nr:divalent-cation tolerance protein CutA [Roseimaritima sediminicola]
MSSAAPNPPERSATEVVVVFTTVANAEDAQRVARHLVQQRLAACVQIDAPIRSVYCWKGETQEETEYRLSAKTTRGRLPELRHSLEKVHPYDVPEILALPVIDGNEAYLQWVADEVA